MINTKLGVIRPTMLMLLEGKCVAIWYKPPSSSRSVIRQACNTQVNHSIVNVSFLYFNWFKHFSPIYLLSGKLSRPSSSQSPIYLSYGSVEGHAAGDRRRIRLARPTIQLKGKNESPSTVGVNFSGGFVWSVCRAPFFVDPPNQNPQVLS